MRPPNSSFCCAGQVINLMLSPCQIVNRESAVLNVTNEVVRYPLRVTHQEMGKFRDAWDQNWQTVASSILELVLLTAPNPQPQPQPQPPGNTGQPPGPAWGFGVP